MLIQYHVQFMCSISTCSIYDQVSISICSIYDQVNIDYRIKYIGGGGL